MTKRVAGWGLLLLTVVNISVLATFGYNRLSDDDPVTKLSIAGAVLTIVGVIWAARAKESIPKLVETEVTPLPQAAE